MISFTCPRCKHGQTRHESEAGSKVVCPSCGQRLQVPSPPQLAGQTVMGKLTGPAALDKTADQPIRFQCPHCRVTIKAPSKKAGSTAKCPKCSLAVQVPARLPVPANQGDTQQRALRELVLLYNCLPAFIKHLLRHQCNSFAFAHHRAKLDELAGAHGTPADPEKWCSFLEDILGHCDFSESLAFLDSLPDLNDTVSDVLVPVLKEIEHVSPTLSGSLSRLRDRIQREIDPGPDAAKAVATMQEARRWLAGAEIAIRQQFPRYRNLVRDKTTQFIRYLAFCVGAVVVGRIVGTSTPQPVMDSAFNQLSDASDEKVAKEFAPVVDQFFQQLAQMRERYADFTEGIARIAYDEVTKAVRELTAWLDDKVRRGQLCPQKLLQWEEARENPSNHVSPSQKQAMEVIAQAIHDDRSERSAIRESARQLTKNLIADLPEPTDNLDHCQDMVLAIITEHFSGHGAHISPQIPVDLLKNAIHLYGVGLSFGHVFALLDSSILGDAGVGTLISRSGLHLRIGRSVFASTAFVSWEMILNPATSIQVDGATCKVGGTVFSFSSHPQLATCLQACLLRLRDTFPAGDHTREVLTAYGRLWSTQFATATNLPKA